MTCEEELTELRAKLAIAETYGKVCDKQIADLSAKIQELSSVWGRK